MAFRFGNSSQQTAWDMVDLAVEDLRKATRSLHKTVEPDSAHMGILGAGSIGGKAESVRQAINKLTKAVLGCAAANPDGKMQKHQVESVLQRIDTDSPLLTYVLRKMGVVHFNRFCELGMGLPIIVKSALRWIEYSTKECFITVRRVNKSPELVQYIFRVRNRLLIAESEALAVYKAKGI